MPHIAAASATSTTPGTARGAASPVQLPISYRRRSSTTSRRRISRAAPSARARPRAAARCCTSSPSPACTRPSAGTATRSPSRGAAGRPRRSARRPTRSACRRSGRRRRRARRRGSRGAPRSGAVELRPGVVGHAAVDRDVAHAAALLHRPDAVERDAGAADERASRLEHDLRLGASARRRRARAARRTRRRSGTCSSRVCATPSPPPTSITRGVHCQWSRISSQNATTRSTATCSRRPA